MKKISIGAFVMLMFVAFSACNNKKDEPQVNVIDGQWVMEELGTTYYWDINHQMPNTVLKGDLDSALQAPFAHFEDSIKSIVYSDDKQSCTITMVGGQIFRFENITATTCTYRDGDILASCTRPTQPFTFKTVHDIDTTTPVQWNVIFYVNDSLLSFFDCKVVDSTATGITEYPVSQVAFEATGRDADAWATIQNKKYPFNESQLRVLTATPSMKSGEHHVYLQLKRTTTPTTGLNSASLMYGYKASTTVENVFPNSVKPMYMYFHNTAGNTVDKLLASVPGIVRMDYYSICIAFAKF